MLLLRSAVMTHRQRRVTISPFRGGGVLVVCLSSPSGWTVPRSDMCALLGSTRAKIHKFGRQIDFSLHKVGVLNECWMALMVLSGM
jgi:hypothetical protein